jgi:protein involved in ribonucleotide reduction
VSQVVVAKSQPKTVKVQEFLTQIDKDDITDVIASGNKADILNFIRNKNILDP